MPQPVLEYLKEKDFRAADRIKRQVPRLYPDDVTNFDGICSQQDTGMHAGLFFPRFQLFKNAPVHGYKGKCSFSRLPAGRPM